MGIFLQSLKNVAMQCYQNNKQTNKTLALVMEPELKVVQFCRMHPKGLFLETEPPHIRQLK